MKRLQWPTDGSLLSGPACRAKHERVPGTPFLDPVPRPTSSTAIESSRRHLLQSRAGTDTWMITQFHPRNISHACDSSRACLPFHPSLRVPHRLPCCSRGRPLNARRWPSCSTRRVCGPPGNATCKQRRTALDLLRRGPSPLDPSRACSCVR